MQVDEVFFSAWVVDYTRDDLRVSTAEAGSWFWVLWMLQVLGGASELRLQHFPVVTDEADEPMSPRVDGVFCLAELLEIKFSCEMRDEDLSGGGGMGVDPRSTACLVELGVVEFTET